jgi:hemin uptake protein HemP
MEMKDNRVRPRPRSATDSPLVCTRGPRFAVAVGLKTMNAPSSSEPSSDEEQSPPPETSAPQKVWRSEELFGDQREVLIVHNNEIYRLRRTRQNKLILNK